jgi:hypothetical protein
MQHPRLSLAVLRHDKSASGYDVEENSSLTRTLLKGRDSLGFLKFSALQFFILSIENDFASVRKGTRGRNGSTLERKHFEVAEDTENNDTAL